MKMCMLFRSPYFRCRLRPCFYGKDALASRGRESASWSLGMDAALNWPGNTKVRLLRL